MDNFTKKHLQDILNAIDDIETFFEGQPKLWSIVINHLPHLKGEVEKLLQE